ncbi:sigma54 specific transcriptional regulator, Fis family [Pseudonocardia dioxanivorans CB1190]|uniref:Sigma54 specific transcriptional regulator, Fis family n=1 Tax=Pseudonocardia dioxanivorans (strain ATCC 55486 / DSM 44775 / JCM 13855 / CB1190) TaxID=675635 RepID=F4CM73_PSEUX|nr:helix-turn-helix domain-containing protein [Pseudonocardia dioxanivorans]AEA22756.1 sigma54 specific transcriptional regulator, Fis family [Pseudonocardia dioxanivorans CB1190]
MRRNEVRHLPAMSSAELERTRRSRLALLDGGLLAEPPGRAGVPPVIENSWRRCIADAVPVAPDHLDYREPHDVLPVLRRAAEPVIDRLAESFGEVPVAMVLSDATGRIVLRHVAVRRQRDVMDRASAAEGFDFSEPSVGTNGLGTVLVERRPVLVRGPEHYNPLLEDLTCAGTPIVEPFTGRMIGSFSLTCATRDVHPLMSVMTGDIGRQIEGRILEEAGERRIRLVEAYLAVDRAGAAALVVDEETVLANRLGLAHTGPELHPLLWQYLAEHGPRRPTRMRVPLVDGPRDALVEPIPGLRPAYSVRLVPAVPSPERTPVRPERGARSEVERELAAVVRHREIAALTGDPGTGKLRTARDVLRRGGAGDPLVVEPATDDGWFDAARTALAAGRGVVVRRVHERPGPTAAQLRTLADLGGPLAITADLDAASDDVVGAVRQVATTVRLPTLAQRRDDLPALVRDLLAELSEPESTTRFAPAAWERLMAWHWPGNLAELRTTVVAMARRAAGGVVELADLPPELRGPRRTLTGMESAERDAVVEALRAAGGNRTRAARALGIGRNTLYRKIREFGID